MSENLAYALVQIVHNFGAAAVVGGAVFSLWPDRPPVGVQRRLAWLVVIGWVAQAVSGSLFGAVSYCYYGQLPDIHGIAVVALGTKVASAILGVLLGGLYLRNARHWSEQARRNAWMGLALLGTVALTAAAFLRWFS